MKKKLIGKLATTILLIVMAFNAVILIRILLLSENDAIFRESKTFFILPDGFTPAKTKVIWNKSSSTPSGWVVRYVSNGCIYCKMDFEWEKLLNLLDRYNYRTIFLLPREVDQFDENQIPSKSIQQIAFVKIDWIKQFRFTSTPTVIIFDNNGSVIWHRNGMLNGADYESAKKAINKRNSE